MKVKPREIYVSLYYSCPRCNSTFCTDPNFTKKIGKTACDWCGHVFELEPFELHSRPKAKDITIQRSENAEKAVRMLRTQGYTSRDIENVLKDIDLSLMAEDIVKEALRRLN